MKQFFKFMLASMLGFILVMGILFFMSFGILVGLMSFTKQSDVAITENTVIKIDFKDAIPERTPANGIFSDLYSGTFKRILGLNDILKSIRLAAEDENIKGIVLDLNYVPSGISTLEEIRNELDKFKESGKFVLCYGEYMTQGAYYLGSVADEIYVNPEGFIDFKGLNAQLMFLKGTLDKLDIDMQIVRHGKFKSAVEPLIQKQMSDENREQYSSFVGSIWLEMLKDISASRNLTIDELNTFADELISYDSDAAVSSGLVDDVAYRDEYRAIVTSHAGIDDFGDINFISLGQYDRQNMNFDMHENYIAVIYANGEIGGGQGSDRQIGSDRFAKTIASARMDDDVKAIVLRVNSPGGGAVASDVIWRELALTQDVKPVIVSMGDVAASGGYWISCASQKILANPTTLTGSIGVFGVIPDFGKFMENELGITYDNVQTNENSGFPSVIRPLKAYERQVLQNQVDNIYYLFLDRVSLSRSMSTEDVDLIGEGRVWSGVDAKKNGLIDDFGGLLDAIDLAAEIAGLEEYGLVELPYQKDPIAQLIEDLTAVAYTKALNAELGPFYNDYVQLKSILEMKGVQARLPYQVFID